MERRRRDEEEREEAQPARALASAPAAGVIGLQRSAGNAAVTRMIQRDFNPLAVDLSKSAVGQEMGAATDTVKTWFDAKAKAVGNAAFVESVPELVAAARELPVGEKTVGDVYKPAEVELLLRERAKFIGVPLLDTRSPEDRAGVAAEAVARLKNLVDKIPTEVTIGGDDASMTFSIAGTVTAKVGGVEAEVSKDGAKASVKHGGAKVGAEVGQKGVKLDVKAGDLVSVKGSVERSGDDWAWKADLQVGTLGKVLGAEDLARLMAGAQKSLGGAAQDLANGIQVSDVTRHGGAVKEAVGGAVEKAKKSAAQDKAGWQVGVSVKGGGKDGGVAGMVTLTWVF